MGNSKEGVSSLSTLMIKELKSVRVKLQFEQVPDEGKGEREFAKWNPIPL